MAPAGGHAEDPQVPGAEDEKWWRDLGLRTPWSELGYEEPGQSWKWSTFRIGQCGWCLRWILACIGLWFLDHESERNRTGRRRSYKKQLSTSCRGLELEQRFRDILNWVWGQACVLPPCTRNWMWASAWDLSNIVAPSAEGNARGDTQL